ncbi:unnamed protein product [Oikopleura dioica]|uniref:Uncharacterized protein n=1 Tax=Oikopleura dioica TaxID=34765 RepID=E4Y2G5_OIKDI|nr:unnamed protein product [Oikopleura dioica]
MSTFSRIKSANLNKAASFIIPLSKTHKNVKTTSRKTSSTETGKTAAWIAVPYWAEVFPGVPVWMPISSERASMDPNENRLRVSLIHSVIAEPQLVKDGLETHNFMLVKQVPDTTSFIGSILK